MPRSFRHLLVLLLVALPLTAQEGRKLGEFTVHHEADTLDVVSQGRTGTCWSFATISFLESELARLHGEEVNLSEMFLVRHAIPEKVKRYVMLEGKTQFSQGGLSHDIIFLGKRYGLAPQSAYPGCADGGTRHDHEELFDGLEKMVERLVEEGAGKRSPEWLQEAAQLANEHMGAPPESFEVEGEAMTPEQYAAEHLEMPWDDYVEVMSFSYAPFHTKAELFVPDNWLRYDEYVNLPLDQMMRGMDHALRKGYTVAVDMDVSEKGFDARNGVAKLPEPFEQDGAITQELRARWFADGKTTDDHLMHVTGIAFDADGKKYYLTKNSWGEVGPHDGYLFISENFMRAKLLAFMVHRDGLPEDCATVAAR